MDFVIDFIVEKSSKVDLLLKITFLQHGEAEHCPQHLWVTSCPSSILRHIIHSIH